MVWVIDFRGDLSETSELNMDGSDSMRAISVVYGETLPEALTNLFSYLKTYEITVTVISRCEKLTTDILSMESTENAHNIADAKVRISKEKPVAFAYAISSEAEKDD